MIFVSEPETPILQIQNLKKYYPATGNRISRSKDMVRAVDGVDLSVYQGEIVGLVGESGSGKTTIGKQIVRLEKPTEGAIYYRGTNIHHWNKKEENAYGTKLQMVFQDPYSSLNPKKRIYDILSAPMLYHGIVAKEDLHKELERLLQMVGLPDNVLDRYPHEFSGGQRQRIGIARALSLKPDFIVCDEPVSALDVSVQAQILNLLKELRKELGLTLLFIAHGLGAVHYISDRIAVMKDGKVIEMGTKEEIFQNPKQEYTKMLLDSILEP